MNEKTYRYSYEDKESMNLLDIQQIAVLLVIYSDLLSYRAVLEGKELINSKYNDSINISKLNPDVTELQSVYLYLIAKLLFVYVGFTRYNNLYDLYLQGEYDYSLEPNIYINIGNIFGLFGLTYLINATELIYNRDISTPIFGIR